jgi:hypothetical protein
MMFAMLSPVKLRWCVKGIAACAMIPSLTSHSIGLRLSLNSEPDILMNELSSEFRLQTAPLGGKSQTLRRKLLASVQPEILVIDEGVFQELELILRGAGPRASTQTGEHST